MRKRWIPEEKRWVEVDEIYKDPNHGLNGPVWCPENGYYDMALNKRFETKREKRAYMREKGLMMEGGSKPQTEGKGVTKYFSYPGQKTKSKGYKYR